MKKAKKAMSRKTKMAGAKPKLACGGRAKKMQSGGRIPPVAKGVGDIEYARKMQEERERRAYNESRGIKYIKTAPKRRQQTRTRNGMPQVLGPDGIWRNRPDLKKNKKK